MSSDEQAGLPKPHGDGAVDYGGIAETGYRFLDRHPRPELMAVSYLHFINMQPYRLPAYDRLATPGGRRRAAALYRLSNLEWLRRAFFERDPSYAGDPLPEKTDILFLSHFVRPNQAATGEDLYFGDLPARLTQNGFRCVVAHLNQARTSWQNIAPQWQHTGTPRLLFGRTLSPAAEWRLYAQARRATKTLKAAAKSSANAFEIDVLNAAAIDALGPATRFALRLGAQVRSLVTALRPRAIVTTLEGHSWERMAWHGAREAQPDIVALGYQHAALFPFQKAMTRRYGQGFDADALLATGTYPAEILRRQLGAADAPVAVLGSVRLPRSNRGIEASSAARTCLVLPEGVVGECVSLGRLAITAARLQPDIQFRMRFHPVVRKEEVLAAAPELAVGTENFTLSDRTLDEDIAESRWALYQGSTAIFSAVMSGLRPVYATPADPAREADPLAGTGDWRLRVGDGASLSDALEADAAENADERARLFAEAQDFCMRYFAPLDSDGFAAMLARMRVTPS